MNQTLLLSAVATLSLGLFGACVAPTPEPPPALPPPAHAYRIEQVPVERGSTYARCTDCAKPTPKTLAGASDRLTGSKPPPATVARLTAPPPTPVKAPRTIRLTLTFDLNSARLTSTAQADLQAAAPIVRRAQELRVTGFTDDLGNQKLNQKLSDARALTVVLKLREIVAGIVPQPQLTGTGRPLCCYVADNGSEARRAPNRRAELLLTVPDTDEVDQLVRTVRPNEPSRAKPSASAPAPLVHASSTAAVAGIATNTNDEP